MISEKAVSSSSFIQHTLLRLNKESLGYIPAILVPSTLNFLLLMLLTRIFAPSDYGHYSLLISTTTFLTIICAQWNIQSLQRYRPEYAREGRQDEFDRNLIRMMIFISIVLVLVSIAMHRIVTGFSLLTSSEYILVVVLIWTQILYTTGVSLFQSDSNVRAYRWFQVANALLRFSIGLVWIYFIENHINGIIYGAILANVALLVPLYVKTQIFNSCSNLFKKDGQFADFLQKFWRFGTPMIGWFLGTAVLDICDRYFLEWFRGSTEVGIYAANYGLAASIIGISVAPLFSAVHPMVMRAESTIEVQHLIKSITKVYFHIAMPLGAAMIVFHHELCTLLLGKEFAAGSPIIPVMVIGFIIWNVSIIGHKGYEYKEKTKVMLIFVGISALVNVVFNFALIPYFGYMGAAYSTLIAFTTYTLLIYFNSKRYVLWQVSKVLLCKLVGLAIIIACIGWFTKGILHDYLPILPVICICFAIMIPLYLFGLIAFRELKLDKLKKVLKRS
ncbi:lipopolysaccharide biosynthesis protein [Paenibacillus periandrae]|uniref:lipopolysaccharide biosynthesis protein n=1 Tax=Paenibacillus periandrae TaxID=1761741 RepID=UPI0023DDBE57|nr:polysaccharide biosynthesis C-terminal domain-containing protein [Paenibacillus periandrae]